MDSPYDHPMEHPEPPMPSEEALLADMKESDEDVAAGRTVPLADVLAELDALVDGMNRRRHKAPV
jgi:hypothetical protein